VAIIKEDDIIQSVADALQYISYYHPADFIQAMATAYEDEASEAAKDAIGQILVNSKMCAFDRRPICQDTGIVVVFVKLGMSVQIQSHRSLQDIIDDGVRQGYQYPDNVLRSSVVAPPIGLRKNTQDNTPAVLHVELVPGEEMDITVAAKGGGSENKSKFTVLNPSDSLLEWVLKTVPTMGAGWCPPGVLGIGVGGTAEKAMLLAKSSLMEPIDMPTLVRKGASNDIEALRLDIYQQVNALGIGAQGLGGLTTVLDVKILDYPTHAASLPVAMIPNCAATRHAHFTLDGSGAVQLPPPDLSLWPEPTLVSSDRLIKVNLDTLSQAEMASWKPGDRLLLTGHILTGRDAAHKRLIDLLNEGKPFPGGVDLKGRFIYYVGPVDPVRDEVVGPAGPTTATRMDKFTEQILAATGLMGMIGKAERGPTAIAAIKKHKATYLMAVGGAAYLVAKAIKSSRVVAFEDLGMEAIREFEVVDMPVTVAVDSLGESVHEIGPKIWQEKMIKLNL
jgi:fumarate hydratase, class I